MKQTFLAANCLLLAVLYINSLVATAAITTVRPYKFGFTIEEQQHRREQRDDKGIVMGEFGFITADGKYHVTVYATDENGKFRIISMKSFPYAGPVATSTSTTSTTRAPLKKHNFNTAACSGCFLSNSAPEENGVSAADAVTPISGSTSSGVQSHKTEIRPLSLPLSPAPAPAADPGKLVPPTQFFQSQAHKLAQLAVSQLQAQAQGQQQGQAHGQTQGPSQGLLPQGQTLGATAGQVQGQLQGLTQGQSQLQGQAQGQLLGQATSFPTQNGLTNGQSQFQPHGPFHTQPQSPLQSVSAGQALSLPLGLSQGQLYYPSTVLPQALPHVQAQRQPQFQLNLDSAGADFVDKGVNVLLPFEQSIAQSVGLALAESQAHTALPSTQQHTQQYPQQQQQYTTQTQHLPSSQSLHTLLNPSTFPTYVNGNKVNIQTPSIDLSNAERIPAAATGPKDLNSHAFGASLTATQKQQQHNISPLASNNGLAQTPTSSQSLPAYGQLAHVQAVPSAASGHKDLNTHVFNAIGNAAGSFPALTTTQKQQQQQRQPSANFSPSASNNGLAQATTTAHGLPANGQFATGFPSLTTTQKLQQQQPSANFSPSASNNGLAHTPTSAQSLPGNGLFAKQPGLHSVISNPSHLHSQSAYQPVRTQIGNSNVPYFATSAVYPLKVNAEHSMKKIVLPVTQEINKFVSQHGAQSATPTSTQHKLTALHAHATPAHTHSNTHTASLNRPLSTNSLTANQKQQGQQPSTYISPTATNNGLAHTPVGSQSLPANGQATKPTLSKSPSLAITGTKAGTGQASIANSPTLATTSTHSEAGQTGDLYRFKYLLDYNGHEETGGGNGNKEGKYFAIGEDAVARTIEYIANEFGFQPHISWRKLDANEVANLPKENSLKEYEFKWFNKESE